MSTAAPAYPRLFQPLRIGERQARNRVVRAATTTNLAEANAVGPKMLAHYARIAEGGVGTIVTDALRVHPATMHGPFGIGAYLESSIPGLSALAATVHAQGALLIGQLNHSGRQHTNTVVPGNLIGPSAIACPRSGGVPHPLSVGEVEELSDLFVAGARNLARAGLDGVELNGAQGHLLQQFLSPFSNRRTDAYGGSEQARQRLATRILERIRETVPADFVVGYRLGVDEFTDGGLTTDMTAAFARHLEQERLVDYVSFSQGNFDSIAAHLPDRHYPETPFASVQARVGAALERVVRIACTRIQRPDQAERILTDGWADAVALGRPLTVDPMWVAKARAGSPERIRPCIQCNSCWSGQHEGLNTLTCVLNSEVGREAQLGQPTPTRAPRHVVVVGGGPGGLETARVAAQRGHRVTLFERETQLGGKAGVGGDAGGHDDFRAVSRWLSHEVEQAGVELRLGERASIDALVAARPDVVVVATGARPVLPDVESDGTVARASGLGDVPPDLTDRTVVVVDEDGHYWAAQVAEEVARRGGRVTLVTRFFEPFRELPIVSRIAALRTLDDAGATMLPMHAITALSSGGVDLRHYDSHRPGRLEPVHLVVWVGPQMPEDDLVAALADRLPEVERHVIGDAVAPRRIRHAMREGFDIAWSLP
ncbi:MAG: FAD-dependent oxidoreductase [Chloroflexi bacterium]|nr:FAD-dependent oxidoreductase [Chloroflexota bacterium]